MNYQNFQLDIRLVKRNWAKNDNATLFERGPRAQSCLILQEELESSKCLSFHPDHGPNWYECYLPTDEEKIDEKKQIEVQPTNYDHDVFKREIFDVYSPRLDINLTMLEVIDFYERIMYNVSFSNCLDRMEAIYKAIQIEIEYYGENPLRQHAFELLGQVFYSYARGLEGDLDLPVFDQGDIHVKSKDEGIPFWKRDKDDSNDISGTK